jgi:structural maintenance of chromosome 4
LDKYKKAKATNQEKSMEYQSVNDKLIGMKDHSKTMKDARHKDFKQGFQLIANHVKQIFRLITNGGDAELSCIDSLDPFSEGI